MFAAIVKINTLVVVSKAKTGSNGHIMVTRELLLRSKECVAFSIEQVIALNSFSSTVGSALIEAGIHFFDGLEP
ncbi:hypothetical protein VCR19J5_880030 [Vibrio crassostreae]|uniref:Uncharacterized protein n=1 Tax=Vibrio crassostreae TaxID=246167 RepID=A0A822N933_9VIBR|nr:hypothetical protein VCR19J5_880030 [Vibrio crassostreae]CDT70029.1 hypothetical protein VCR5J5_80031 [Vibrio crassostreae]